MKISLIAPTYLPARRANTIQVMKMGQALKSLGNELQVLVPLSKTEAPSPSWPEISHHYGLKEQLDIEWLPTTPQFRSYDYALRAVRKARQWGADLVYTRLPQAAAIVGWLGTPLVYEIHDLPRGKLGFRLFQLFVQGKHVKLLVVITSALKESVNKLLMGYHSELPLSVLVAPDGVDLGRYQDIPSPQEARQAVFSNNQLHPSKVTVGYTGHLYPGRGVDLILNIARQLTDINFLLVGGEPEDVMLVQQKIHSHDLKNIMLTGFVPNAELPLYQAACDILLMPYQYKVAASSGGDISAYLSPMKLFEYMASGRAIVSSDLPVLREILNEKNAYLLPPDNLQEWVEVIQKLSVNPDKRARIGLQAQSDSYQYSWKNRAQKIISAIDVETKKHLIPGS